MNNETIKAAWKGIQERLKTSDFVVFHTETIDSQVEWSGDDWSAFINAAEASGSRLLYVSTYEFSRNEIDGISEQLEGEASPVLVSALRAARANLGHVCRVELGFAYAGVIHRWTGETDWLPELDELDIERGDSIRGRYGREHDAAVDLEAARLAPQIEQWVELISQDASYVGASNQATRRRRAEELVSELHAWISGGQGGDPQAQARWRAAYDVLDRAELKLTEVKNQRLATAKAASKELSEALLRDPNFSAARSAALRVRLAGEFVEHHLGFRSADVRDRILSIIRERS